MSHAGTAIVPLPGRRLVRDRRRRLHRLELRPPRARRDAGPGRHRRQADLCRQPREPGRRARTTPRVRFVRADIADRAAMASSVPASTGPRRSSTSRPRRTSIVRSTARRRSSRPTSSARSCCSTWRAAYYGGARCRGARRFRFLHVSTDEVYGSLGADGLFTETTPYAPNSPYAASKAGADHLVRAYHHTYGLPAIITNCSNNYGPFQFPGEADSADDPPGGRAAGRCRFTAPAPTCATGCTSRITAPASGWRSKPAQSGEKYNIGGGNERTNLRGGRPDLQRCSTTLVPRRENDRVPEGTRRYADLKTFVRDRPGHDARYAIDAGQDPARAGMAAAVRLRLRAGADGALVSRQQRLVRRGPRRTLRRRAARPRGARGRGRAGCRPRRRRFTARLTAAAAALGGSPAVVERAAVRPRPDPDAPTATGTAGATACSPLHR